MPAPLGRLGDFAKVGDAVGEAQERQAAMKMTLRRNDAPARRRRLDAAVATVEVAR